MRDRLLPREQLGPKQPFVDRIGYDAVDAGSLAEGWRFQPNTPAYGTNDLQRPRRLLRPTPGNSRPGARETGPGCAPVGSV
jgi:hypothetical protein